MTTSTFTLDYSNPLVAAKIRSLSRSRRAKKFFVVVFRRAEFTTSNGYTYIPFCYIENATNSKNVAEKFAASYNLGPGAEIAVVSRDDLLSDAPSWLLR